MEYKGKYIKLRSALSAVKRGNATEEELSEVFGEMEDYVNVSQYVVDMSFDRKDRAKFIKVLKKNKVDLHRLGWVKSELDKIRSILDTMNEGDKYYEWYRVSEVILDGMLNDSFTTLVI